MKFLIDAQLPPDLVPWLTARGHFAEHVFDLLTPEAEDDAVWALAVRSDAALMTKDEDFVTLRTRFAAGPSIVWLRIGNATNPHLFAWLSRRHDSIVDALITGAPVIEVR